MAAHNLDFSGAGDNEDTLNESGSREKFVQRSGETVHAQTLKAEREALLAENARLRTANENLVMAALDVQTMREEAEAANRRRNEFLAMLAHELRNPLAALSMASSLLARILSLPEPISDLQQIIQRQVSHLSRLLDDLLDAARINSGKITLTLHPVALAELLSSAVESVESRISERQQHLELNLDPSDIVLIGDAIRLGQVLSNLLINASKFTQDGGKIMVSTSGTSSHVVIKVSDNGAGISPELVPHIFTLFTQGPQCLARSEGGLGIGLNIVRNIVELHGGSVEASSAGEGHGSIFTLTLPLSDSAQLPHPIVSSLTDRSHDLRVIVVEDNIDANNTLSTFLRLEGFTVANAYDGVVGLSMVNSEHFDVLICDIGLPGMDGFDLIQKLRNTRGGNMPLAVALSGYGSMEDKARAIAAGFDQYLVKPVEITQLLNVIAKKTESKGF